MCVLNGIGFARRRRMTGCVAVSTESRRNALLRAICHHVVMVHFLGDRGSLARRRF